MQTSIVHSNDLKNEFLSMLEDMQIRFEAMGPELEVTVSNIEMGVEGYIVVWNTGISKGGPLEFSGKGGTRISKDVSLEDIKMLARSAALKNAAAGLAMGGAKSGLKADPLDNNFEQKYRCFVKLCAPYLLENGGLFGGFGYDIGANPIHATWACNELNSTRCFTGKSIEMGGTDYDREGIAGLGVAVAAKALLECYNQSADGARFAVQGMGAMGAAVIRYFSERGGKLSAIADPKFNGTWLFENTISDILLEALIDQDIETSKTCLEKEATFVSIDSQDVLYQDIDVLFPCAIQYVINKDNVKNIKARFVCEGANNPTTEEGYQGFVQQGIHFVPDFIANPGGVISAFVELTSDITIEDNIKTRAKVIEAKEMTIERITANVAELTALVKKYNVSPHKAGLYMALKKILGEDS